MIGTYNRHPLLLLHYCAEAYEGHLIKVMLTKEFTVMEICSG